MNERDITEIVNIPSPEAQAESSGIIRCCGSCGYGKRSGTIGPNGAPIWCSAPRPDSCSSSAPRKRMLEHDGSGCMAWSGPSWRFVTDCSMGASYTDCTVFCNKCSNKGPMQLQQDSRTPARWRCWTCGAIYPTLDEPPR